jgi:hypothetical protein
VTKVALKLSFRSKNTYTFALFSEGRLLHLVPSNFSAVLENKHEKKLTHPVPVPVPARKIGLALVSGFGI